MLISWIKQFIRVSAKGKFYTIVNTLGLSIGLMCTIIILLWADFQMSYDKFHPDYQKIFQVYKIQSFENGFNRYSYSTPGPLSDFLNQKFPEISSSVRFHNFSAVIGMGDKSFRELQLGFTDSTFFNIFKVEFISGNSKICFKDANSIVLTEKLAKKIFGTTDVVGKSVRLNGKLELNVTAIIKDYPKNSNIQFSCLIPFDKVISFGYGTNRWNDSQYSTFVKLDRTDNIKGIEKNIQFETKKGSVSENVNFNLQPIERVRLYNPDPSGFSFILFITILVSVAGFVLILACINFINLITARSANRAKEVGIRKVFGSSRLRLIVQYFMESFLNTILALFIAILFVDFALPSFNSILGTELVMKFTNLHFWSKILIVVLGVGIASGIYPAFVLSSFQPAKVLKGLLRSGLRGDSFRKIMVIVQYTITIFLVVVTFFLFKQLNFITNVNTGMSRKNVISIPFSRNMNSNYKSFKNELMKIPNVKYATGVEDLPFQIGSSTDGVSWDGKDTTQTYSFSCSSSDEFMTDAMEIKMAEGRYFSSKFPSDISSVVINEVAAKTFSKKTIIGETITIWGRRCTIIGVMKDFHFTHFSGKIQPLFIRYNAGGFFILVKSQNSFDSQTLDRVKKVYADFYPEYPFESTFVDDDYQNMYLMEKQLKSILGEFTILAILISCVGLLSLASYIAEQQRKSLVLRKIHGASLLKIIVIQLSSFTKWVIISGVIAIPLSYLALKARFGNYAYHTEFSWWIFAGAVFAALIIAVLTVLYQAVKTARINPMEVLRYE